MKEFDYSVAIRTLGKAGQVYNNLIESLLAQTIPPKGIFVYIAEGYAKPSQVADEIYSYCPKGMVAQRSLPFDEITSEYILFCDDDVFLPQDAVQKLFTAMEEYGASCVAPSVFPNEKMPLLNKLVAGALYGTFPSFFSRYAFKIRKSSYYSYSCFPKKVMLTQSFAGPCFLLKKSAYQAVNFKEERWLDSFVYANGEDQMLAYKLFVAGFVLLVHYDTGVVHNDARTSHVDGRRERDYNNRVIRYIIWYRSIYQLQDSFWGKLSAMVSFYSYWLWLLFLALISWLLRRNTSKVKDSFLSLRQAKAIVNSEEFKSIPTWQKISKKRS